MKCLNCGKQIDDDSKFCPFCGKSIIKELICPNCGLSNSVSARFCKECGTALTKKEELKENSNQDQKAAPKAKNKDPKRTKEIVKNICSITAMVLMFVSMLMIIGLSFAPLLEDNFFPNSTFTIINYLTNAFDSELKDLSTSYSYVLLAGSIMLIALLSAVVVVGVILIALNATKLVKAIKEKEYFDFSKIVIIHYVLFLGLFFYFTNMCVRTDYYMTCTYNGLIIFEIIIIPVFLIFNLFVKESLKEDRNIPSMIKIMVIRLVILVFILIAAFNLSGIKFNIVAQITNDKVSPSSTINDNITIGNLNTLNYFIEMTYYLYTKTMPLIIPIFILAGVSLLLEIVSLLFLLQLLVSPLTYEADKKENYMKKIILSGVIIVSTIAVMILGAITNAAMQKIDSTNLYDATIHSTVNYTKPIVALVFSTLLLGTYIGLIAYEKSVAKKRIEDEA